MRGHQKHATEVSISTLLEEPPSPKGLRKLFSNRQLSLAYHNLTKRLVQIIPALFIGLVVLAHGKNLYNVWRANAAPQSNDQAERISFVLSNYIQLDTLQTAPSATDFSSIALAGQNIGGTPENPTPQVQQYTVQPGDTLSGIASQFNLHSGSILLANAQLTNADMLHIGQVLTIPLQDATSDQLAKLAADQQKALAKALSSKQFASSKVHPATSTTPQNFSEPISYRYVSQGFNIYVHPGEDLVASIGTPVRAIADGCLTIEASGWDGGYGNFIMLNVGNGYEARYAHLSRFAGLSVGSCVARGTVIGYSGNTGNSTGPHLHFEIRKNGVPINPNM